MPTRLGAEGQVRGVQRFTVLITPLHTVTQERSDESALYRIGDRFYIDFAIHQPVTAFMLLSQLLELSLRGNGSDVKDSILVLLLHVARCAMNHMGVIDARSLNAVAERAAPLPERR